METRRFGPGHRRLGGPPGTQGVEGTVIYSDDRAHVSELAFQRYAFVVPHSNAHNTAVFIVISGGGYVQVGDERSRINHGEAVVWPRDIPHGAYTDGSEMRAIVVEMLTGDQPEVIEGAATEIVAGQVVPDAGPPTEEKKPITRADGQLAERQRLRDEYDTSEGEPW